MGERGAGRWHALHERADVRAHPDAQGGRVGDEHRRDPQARIRLRAADEGTGTRHSSGRLCGRHEGVLQAEQRCAPNSSKGCVMNFQFELCRIRACVVGALTCSRPSQSNLPCAIWAWLAAHAMRPANCARATATRTRTAKACCGALPTPLTACECRSCTPVNPLTADPQGVTPGAVPRSCFQRSGRSPTPTGCAAGGEGDAEHFDYCVRPPALLNMGADCWGGCRESGLCSWCGDGKCCRRGWKGGERGCAAGEGGEGHHTCIPPAPALTCPKWVPPQPLAS